MLVIPDPVIFSISSLFASDLCFTSQGLLSTSSDLTGDKMQDRIDSHDSDAMETAESKDPDKEITTLAQSISRVSRQNSLNVDKSEGVNTFLDPTADPELDPNSDTFISRKWVRNMLKMVSHDLDRYPRRTVGVSFRNLNVFGYGTAADYQMNFANTWLKAADWLRGVLGMEKKVRIDILREFEGIVHSGEMLVVLGRPGRYVKAANRRLYSSSLPELLHEKRTLLT
jgi:hypothetical protein